MKQAKRNQGGFKWKTPPNITHPTSSEDRHGHGDIFHQRYGKPLEYHYGHSDISHQLYGKPPGFPMDFLFSKLYLGFFFLKFSLPSWHRYSSLGSLNTVSFPLKITTIKVLFKEKTKQKPWDSKGTKFKFDKKRSQNFPLFSGSMYLPYVKRGRCRLSQPKHRRPTKRI